MGSVAGAVKRHIVLIGLPGSGKSAVGRAVAERLDAAFDDLDESIERATGQSISEIFAARGEPAFRELERQAMCHALVAPPRVIAPGGGWAVQAGSLESAREASFTIYLITDPRAASERVAGTNHRPLLEQDQMAAMEALFASRDRRYRLADASVSTRGRTMESVVDEVTALARDRGGW